MVWMFMMLSLGIVIWWALGLAIGLHIGHKNGLELAEIDEPEEPHIFGSNNTFGPSNALGPNEIDEIDEWDDH